MRDPAIIVSPRVAPPNAVILPKSFTESIVSCFPERSTATGVSGGDAKIVHINDLRNGREKLKNYHILALPGGFAYGDDIASGKILAVELTSFLQKN